MKKKLLLISVLAIHLLGNLFLAPCPAANKDGTTDNGWHALETSHTIIKYKSMENLNKFDKAVNYNPAFSDIGWLYIQNANTLQDKIRNKIDAIFKRTQEILDMRKSMKKVTIKLYGNKENLQKAFQNIVKNSRHYRAGYIFENNAIYLNVNDINAGMLAHEMAHAVIDHYMTVRPPSAAAEILARYVDSYLMKRVAVFKD